MTPDHVTDSPLALDLEHPDLPDLPLQLSRVDVRLYHLFRASLRNGRIHPLYLPVLRYRHAQAGQPAAE